VFDKKPGTSQAVNFATLALRRCPLPLDITTFTFVDKPVTLQEGMKILERDGYKCRYCGLDGNSSFENALVMTVDFVFPRARKGKKNPENLVACCWACNAIKGKRVYKSLEDAKEHILARREELRKAWQARSRRGHAAAASA
jgi:HNH endonuclease